MRYVWGAEMCRKAAAAPNYTRALWVTPPLCGPCAPYAGLQIAIARAVLPSPGICFPGKASQTSPTGTQHSQRLSAAFRNPVANIANKVLCIIHHIRV